MTDAAPLRRRTRRGIVHAVTALVALVLSTGIVAADNGVTPQVNSVQSVIHMLGIAASLLLGYYGNRARERYKGGALAGAATYVIVGALLFALAFLVKELDHGLGINVFAPVGDMHLQMGLSMLLFTGTVFAFGWAFYRMTRELKEWYT